jgi:hypothetical protein
MLQRKELETAMSSTIPRIQIDLSRAELVILVEAIMCATSSERPGLAEASQMREIALRLQEALSETRPPDGIRPGDEARDLRSTRRSS